MDPRLDIIDRRLAGVKRIVAVTGGKGGIGKSLVAATLAGLLPERGLAAGLLDLDFTGPCDHTILGIHGPFPEERFGLVPPEVHGVRFMSVTHFVGEQPAPLRGQDLSNALIELLAITQWGHLDVLVIDMPPGIGDATLDAVRLIPRAEFLVITTASRIVCQTVARTLRLLADLDARRLGLVENMCRGEPEAGRQLARAHGIAFLGALPYDEAVEAAVGAPERLLNTSFAAALRAATGGALPGPDS